MRKMKSKLYFQISLIIIPLFLLTAAVISYIVYNSTLNGFLEAHNESMEHQLETVLNELGATTDATISKRTDWYFDMFEKYTMKMLDKPTDEETSEYNKYKDQDDGTLEWIQNAPEAVQKYYVKQFYKTMRTSILNMFWNNSIERLFIVDVSQANMGMVICDYSMTDDYRIGEYYKMDLSELPKLKSVIESPQTSFNVTFERSDSFPVVGDNYLAYLPIPYNDETRAVICISYNWNRFNRTLRLTVFKTIIVCFVALTIVLVLLQIIIYRRATAPIGAIQQTVRKYKDDKDSGKVVSEMSRIKVRNELGLLSQDISELAKEIDFYTNENVRLAAEKERVAAELDMATKIQADQLPSKFPDSKEFDIFASMTPAKEVGGDFYDFFFVDDDHLALVIADVSGKGVPAALFMMMSKNLIRNLTAMGLSPKEVIEKANQTICDNNKQRMFVTVWLGILEISTGKVTAVNAGHEIPFIKQPGGEFELFEDPHGLMVGAFKTAKYQQYEFALQKGGTLFVYTDGVAEATNADDEMFGTDRLKQALDKDTNASPKQLLETVHSDVDAFVGSAEQFDDLTMLGLTLH